MPRRPLRLKTLKIGKQVFCLPSVKCCRSHAPCICYVVMRASSDELEASIDPVVLAPEVEVSPSPSEPLTKERLQAGNLFPTVKWPPSHATCRKYVTCHLPRSDDLYVPFDPQRIAKEPNAARSPSPWKKTNRLAIRKLIPNLLVPSRVWNLQVESCSS